MSGIELKIACYVNITIPTCGPFFRDVEEQVHLRVGFSENWKDWWLWLSSKGTEQGFSL